MCCELRAALPTRDLPPSKRPRRRAETCPPEHVGKEMFGWVLFGPDSTMSKSCYISSSAAPAELGGNGTASELRGVDLAGTSEDPFLSELARNDIPGLRILDETVIVDGYHISFFNFQTLNISQSRIQN